MSVIKSKRMPVGYGLLTIGTVLACLCGYAIQLYNIESVLISVPLIAILAGILWAVAAKYRHSPGLRIAYFILLFIFCMTLLTWIANWGPHDAREPFAFLGAAFVLTLFVLSNRSFANAPNRYKDWQCQECGYPLYGLTATHCPECGNDLDPILLEIYCEQKP